MRCSLRWLAILVVSALLGTAAAPPVYAQGGASTPTPPATLTARVDEAIDDLAAELAWDPEAAHEWVSSNVALAPYDGVLKGARGSYLTRSANDADQALLLAGLLERSLIPYRYAMCWPMREERASTDPTADESQTLAIHRARDLMDGVTDQDVKKAILAVQELRRRHKEASERAAADLAVALSALPPPSAEATTPETEGSRQHVWVQMAFGAGWKNLDTTSATGDPPCEPEQTFLALPAEMAHRLRVVLEVERLVGDELATSDALVAEAAMADVSTTSIAFVFGEPAGLVERGPLGTAGTSGSSRSLSEYTPILLIDDRSITGKAIAVPPPSGAVLDAGAVIEDIGDEIIGREEPSSEHEESEPVTGAWLLIELIAPDGSMTELRSEVFDRLGIVARSDTAPLISSVDALEEVNGEYAALTALWQIGVLVGEARVPEIVGHTPSDPGSIGALTGQLDALLRIFPALYRDLGGRSQPPMVLLAGLTEGHNPQGDPTSRVVFDALHVPGRPPPDWAAAAADAHAVLGAEAMLASLLGVDSADPEDSRSVFAASRATSTPLAVLSPGDSLDIDDTSPEARLRMSRRLAGGGRLLVPVNPPSIDGVKRTAWWYVHPETAVVRDEHENGRHTEAGEYTIQMERMPRTVEHTRRYSCALVGTTVAVAIALLAGVASPHLAINALPAARALQVLEEKQRLADAAREVVCSRTGGV